MLCEEPQFMAEYPYTRVPLLRNDERAQGDVLAKFMGAPPHKKNPPQRRRILRGNRPDFNSMTRPRISEHAMSRKAGDQAVSSKTPAQ